MSGKRLAGFSPYFKANVSPKTSNWLERARLSKHKLHLSLSFRLVTHQMLTCQLHFFSPIHVFVKIVIRSCWYATQLLLWGQTVDGWRAWLRILGQTHGRIFSSSFLIFFFFFSPCLVKQTAPRSTSIPALKKKSRNFAPHLNSYCRLKWFQHCK